MAQSLKERIKSLEADCNGLFKLVGAMRAAALDIPGRGVLNGELPAVVRDQRRRMEAAEFVVGNLRSSIAAAEEKGAAEVADTLRLFLTIPDELGPLGEPAPGTPLYQGDENGR